MANDCNHVNITLDISMHSSAKSAIIIPIYVCMANIATHIKASISLEIDFVCMVSGLVDFINPTV